VTWLKLAEITSAQRSTSLEVLGPSHLILVLDRGRKKGILQASKASKVAIMELATT